MGLCITNWLSAMPQGAVPLNRRLMSPAQESLTTHRNRGYQAPSYLRNSYKGVHKHTAWKQLTTSPIEKCFAWYSYRPNCSLISSLNYSLLYLERVI